MSENHSSPLALAQQALAKVMEMMRISDAPSPPVTVTVTATMLTYNLGTASIALRAGEVEKRYSFTITVDDDGVVTAALAGEPKTT